MTTLELRILTGQEDTRLMDIINRLEYIRDRKDGGNGLSHGETKTLNLVYRRLDAITDPSFAPEKENS